MAWLRWLLWTLAVAVACYAAVVLVMRMLFPLPSLDGRTESAAMPATAQTLLGKGALAEMAAHPGKSGVLPLGNGVDAFAARMVLARAAQASIDARYYIWSDDLTGLLLLNELQGAAARGVRVRLLVDDNGTRALDPELAALDAMPTVEVRIFNPFTLRSPRLASYLFDFSRLNRRMHNKSMTVDGALTVIGGRNIGDVYFDTGNEGLYFDLDVLALGPVVDKVGADFDAYWSSGSSYPALSLIKPTAGGATRLAERAATARQSPQGRAYAKAVEKAQLATDLAAGTLQLEWTDVMLFSDDPAKGLGKETRDGLMLTQLFSAMPKAEKSLDLVSAYFIPEPQGTKFLVGLAQSGVAVTTLTNALEATDVIAVQSGYAKYRGRLVDGGVTVRELRSESGDRKTVNDFGEIGVSSSALHAKSFAVDGKRIFIGSFNFDPRSARLNCEMGFLIESPTLAAGFEDWMRTEVPSMSYLVRRDGEGHLVWDRTDPDGSVTTLTVEPNSSLPLRTMVTVLGWLPVEWML
jgi:putative cardiolipin synthase